MLNFHLYLTVLMLVWHSYSAVVQPVGFAVAVRIESLSPAVVVVEFVELNSAGFAPAVAVPEVSTEGSNSAAKLLVVSVYFAIRHSIVVVASVVAFDREEERLHFPDSATPLPVLVTIGIVAHTPCAGESQGAFLIA